MPIDSRIQDAAREWPALFSGGHELSLGLSKAFKMFEVSDVCLRVGISDDELAKVFRGHAGSKSDAFSALLEFLVFLRSDYRCVYCGDMAEVLDHVDLRSRQGPMTLSNLVAACWRCNSQRGKEEIGEWLASMRGYAESLTVKATAWRSIAPEISSRFQHRADEMKRKVDRWGAGEAAFRKEMLGKSALR